MTVQGSAHVLQDNQARQTRLLTVTDVAEALAVSQPTVWRLADSGELPRVRVGPGGRLVRFRVADLDALVKRGSEQAGGGRHAPIDEQRPGGDQAADPMSSRDGARDATGSA